MDELDLSKKSKTSLDGSIVVGTSCKRGGCTCSYDSFASNGTVCVHHPGVPVFHEGYKFWSCCKKKTSDFTAFLAQAGCESGKHKWISDEQTSVNCRWDWHQTPSTVVVAIYAKQYNYKQSFVKVSPVRLIVKLIFPKEDRAEFNIDLELRGVIDATKATASMFGTKLEISMPKAEGSHWTNLDFPRNTPTDEIEEESMKNGAVAAKLGPKTPEPEIEEDEESDVDLDDLEVVRGAKITELGELARTCQLVEDVVHDDDS